MKKILSLLGASAITTIGTTNVVACGKKPVEIKYSDEIQTLALKGSYIVVNEEDKTEKSENYDYINTEISGEILYSIVPILVNESKLSKSLSKYLDSIKVNEDDFEKSKDKKWSLIFGRVGIANLNYEKKIVNSNKPQWFSNSYSLKETNFYQIKLDYDNDGIWDWTYLVAINWINCSL